MIEGVGAHKTLSKNNVTEAKSTNLLKQLTKSKDDILKSKKWYKNIITIFVGFSKYYKITKETIEFSQLRAGHNRICHPI